MRLLISAAEASSDVHGAALLKALQDRISPHDQTDVQIEAFGVGGPQLQAAGLRVIVPAQELLAMGFFEILKHLPRIFRALNEITAEVDRVRPDVAIVIDYPDFHFRLARRLKKRGIPVIYYIPPKVWAWRKGRVKFLKNYFEKILCILPFEEEFYRGEGIPVKYVGNPLVDELPLSLSRSDARRKLHLTDSEPVLVLMPGSRESELKAHLEIMLTAAKLAFQKGRRSELAWKILMPLPLTADRDAVAGKVALWVETHACGPDIQIAVRVSQGDAAECLVAADAALVKSGTSTLEAGLLLCPHAVVYKPNRASAWIFNHWVRYRGPVGLVNLVAGSEPGEPPLVREILCDAVTAETLSEEILSLLFDEARRKSLQEGFKALRERVCGRHTVDWGNKDAVAVAESQESQDSRKSPSQIAAQEIWQTYLGFQP